MPEQNQPTFIIDKSNIDRLSRSYLEEAIKEDTEELAEHYSWTFDVAMNSRLALIREGLCSMVASRPPRKREMT